MAPKVKLEKWVFSHIFVTFDPIQFKFGMCYPKVQGYNLM